MFLFHVVTLLYLTEVGGGGVKFRLLGKTPMSPFQLISIGEWNKPFPYSMQFEQNNMPLPLYLEIEKYKKCIEKHLLTRVLSNFDDTKSANCL